MIRSVCAGHCPHERSSSVKNVEIFTDGACKGNPGPGGWGAILRYGGAEKEISGGAPDTTNNKMELSAVIEALKCLKEPCAVTVYSDSTYVCNSINNGWVKNWKAKNWVNKGKPVPNTDLWKELLELLSKHRVAFEWVRGHNGHPENERCDRLAVAQAERFKQS